ncbi:helix-turn-helix domain-containing protein [Streptomyces sp. NPDC050485]|uniref:helix-turn-helix domain-containing protein n=1 Tax=Streptomyces sp. NPDC050485 TaxID=3365617 RepID=UPI00378D465F
MAFTERELTPEENPWKFLGSEIRRLRQAKKPDGWKASYLAALVHISPGLLSQFETGIRRPEAPMVEHLDNALEAGGHLMVVYRLAMNTDRPSTDLAEYFAAIADLEPRARRIDWYGGQLFPGLLQTPEYAEEITRKQNPFLSGDKVAELVAKRMKRAKVLDGPNAPRLLVVVDEVALQRPIGTSVVMGEQLNHLAETVRDHRAVVQILETKAGAHPLLAGQLIIMHFEDAPPLAYMEGPHGGLSLERPDHVDACQLSYHLTCAAALSPDASLDLIESVAREYKQ